MEILKTDIEDLFILEPKIFSDNRGYFYESYNKNNFIKKGLHYDFIQDNESFSSYGTIRGLHIQVGEFSQAKLIKVVKGSIIDVVVDLRVNSKTFGKHFTIKLSEENKKQLLIPRNFAHGFSVISENAIVSYKIDNLYNKESECSILYNDNNLNIDWEVEKKYHIVSDKDLSGITFEYFKQKYL
jgi:dTDP-4-dehydrorhamnose 3,5-epimerase